MENIPFDAFGFDAHLLRAIADLGFVKPTTIQSKIWQILQNQDTDIIGLAQTGTGKTAAFGMPLLQRVNTKNKHVQALILCPTRELCLQIAEDLMDFAKYEDQLHIVPVYGGASINTQINEIRSGAQIVVATPGRLCDLIDRGAVKLEKVSIVVLDEADEMLSMGFKADLDLILGQTPANKQTWLFSATMPTEVERIAREYMSEPQQVEAQQKNTGASNIEHVLYVTQATRRYLALKRVADYYPDIYGIIFCRTKIETQQVADDLMKDGYNADALHGDLSQAQRDAVMKKFRQRNLQMLVATDVAARGIDVDDVSHVIHYNLPDDFESYTHRSGRTARAGKSGMSIAITTPKDMEKVALIERKTKIKFARKPLPNGAEVCERQLISLMNKAHDVQLNHEIEAFFPQISERFADMEKDEILRRFLSLEFSRFLNYYKNAPDLNESLKRSSHRGEPMSRYFINIGDLDRIDKGQMVRFICERTGLVNAQLGKIEIKRSFSFFEVPTAEEGTVEKKLARATLNGRTVKIEKSDAVPERGRNRERSHSKESRYGSSEQKSSSGYGKRFKEKAYSGGKPERKKRF